MAGGFLYCGYILPDIYTPYIWGLNILFGRIEGKKPILTTNSNSSISSDYTYVIVVYWRI